MKNKSIAITIAGTLLISTLAVMQASGHQGATGIVKERMDEMVAMGKAMGSIADMFKGKSKFDPKQVESASDVILMHSKNITNLFPDTKASRAGKHTAALPPVWEKRDDFNAVAKLLEKRAQELKAIAPSGDQAKIRAAFGTMAKACSSCHQDFRKKKD